MYITVCTVTVVTHRLTCAMQGLDALRHVEGAGQVELPRLPQGVDEQRDAAVAGALHVLQQRRVASQRARLAAEVGHDARGEHAMLQEVVEDWLGVEALDEVWVVG